MNDQEFSDLLSKARSAGGRVDVSAMEYGFETRLTARLAAGAVLGGVSTVQAIWRMAAGCAALVGVMAVWFILTQASTETEDDLTAFWDSAPVALEVDLAN